MECNLYFFLLLFFLICSEFCHTLKWKGHVIFKNYESVYHICIPVICMILHSNCEGEGGGEVAQSCPTLCDPMDYIPPGSSIHGILWAEVLEWVAISFSRGSSQFKDLTRVSVLHADTLPSEPKLLGFIIWLQKNKIKLTLSIMKLTFISLIQVRKA